MSVSGFERCPAPSTDVPHTPLVEYGAAYRAFFSGSFSPMPISSMSSLHMVYNLMRA